MIRRPPRSTLSSSSAASDVYKRQVSTQSTGATQHKMKLPEAKPCHRRYYMPSEVAQHCTPEDCWLSWFNEVYDLSPVLEQHKGIDTKPLVDSAGQDISHWFDEESGNLRQRFGEDLVKLSFTPLGDVLHKPPSEPRSNWANNFQTPWWRDGSLKIATLSQQQRQVRIVNTLTHHEHVIEV
eukprot:TRINITY_DN2816_c0_g2_i1.p1 TRINITY_DN2816_c0_g2~~TRINITY_DN2816_c0_g2_i1.p1  ORF type:complete len:181 (+),score=38.42 TRINITY_DN2816_c0_g2_i1:98-640(+)